MFSFRNKVIKLLSVLAILLVSASVFAQEDSDWYFGKTISAITFEGLKSVKKSDLTGVTNNFIGRSFTEDVYSELLDRLYSLSYFEDIEPYAKHDGRSADKVVIVFTVKEHPVISTIDFKGNKKIRNNELRDAVSIKTGDVFIPATVLVDERSLRDLYIKKGYSNASVSYTQEETKDGVKVVFNIVEGSGTVITSIKFSGNTVFSARTLKGKISLKEEGFARDGAFQRSSLETDKQTIVSYYNTKGYIDTRIIDVIQESVQNTKKNREELSLTFIIQEGAQYTFGGISITGNQIFTTDRLMAFVKIKPGEIFNQTKFQEGLSGISNEYYENGYMSNEFYPNIEKDSERHVISYQLRIVEHSRAHVENIIIKGNTKTKDKVILREIPLESGDVFSREKVMQGLRNLYNLQYFSSIVPEPVSGSEENLVDLVISVEEQSTTSLQLGMTFSGIENPDDLPVSLFFKWQNSNLMGLGKTISSGLNLSTSEQSVDLSYGQSWLFDQPISFNESLSFFHSDSSALFPNWLADGRLDDDYYYFNYESIGASLSTGFGRRWLPNFAIFTLSCGMTNSLTDNMYTEGVYTPIDPGVSKYANRLGLKDSVYVSASLDNRDINYDPSKGWFFNDRLSWYGLLPGIEHEFYLRNEAKAEAYLTLFDIPVVEGYFSFKAVLAAYTGLTTIYPVPGSQFSQSSKAYIDGMFNGRGWTSIYNSTRGKGMLSNRVELRMPIFQGVVGLDGFFDAVAVKDEPEQIFNNLSLDDFYFSFGPGLRFLIPQFPLHLLFANCFRIQDGETKWEDTWKFVLSFNMTNR